MNPKLRAGVLLIVLLLASPAGFAQNSSAPAPAGSYRTGIGLRAGSTPGLSIKTFVRNKSAFEGLFHFRSQGFILTGLYEAHKTAFGFERLNWFYGAGAHIGSFRGGYYRNKNGEYYNKNFIAVGIDGILGLEYHFTEIPFTAGVDIKPYLDIVSPGLGYWDGALTLRYAF
jgi:hypothetical protein